MVIVIRSRKIDWEHLAEETEWKRCVRHMHGDALMIWSRAISRDSALHAVKYFLLLPEQERSFDAVFLRFDRQRMKEKYSRNADLDINRAPFRSMSGFACLFPA